MEMLTVVTPTYNRSSLLKKCYDSLLAQTSKNFVWLIVDDGSTDGTEQVVQQNWSGETQFKIEYRKKENGGKASALNLALDCVQTPYVVCLDSDDTFTESAVELALQQLSQITDPKCCGILALRNTPKGAVMGGVEIPKTMLRVTAADVILKLALRTEYICFYRTDILKQYRFPEFPGEKFVPPSWMMFQITQEYYYQTSWDRFCVCEYIADGLTKNKKKVIIKNPKGYASAKRWAFDCSPSLILTIKNGIMYDCGCFIAKDTQWLKNTKRKLWAIILYPLGVLTYYLRFHK